MIYSSLSFTSSFNEMFDNTYVKSQNKKPQFWAKFIGLPGILRNAQTTPNHADYVGFVQSQNSRMSGLNSGCMSI